MKDMSPVGASASTSKSAERMKNTEYDGTGSFRKSDNGGYILSLGRRMKPSSKRGNDYPSYCPSEELTFDDKKAFLAAVEKHCG